MNPIRMTFAATLLALASLAAAPVYGGTVLDIAEDQLQAYWTPTAMLTSSRLDPDVFMTRSGQLKPMAEKVTITYVIGSDGEVRDAEVVEAQPENASGEWALVAAQAGSYEPAAGNLERTPVRITHTVTMNTGMPAAD